jgi:HEAT repeat protein
MKAVRFGGLIAKQWPVVGGVLLVAAVGGLLGWSPWEQRQAEPVYEGKPISYWLAPSVGGSRVFPPKGMVTDSNAIPFLVEALNRQSTPFEKAYSIVWPRLSVSLRRRLGQPANPPYRREVAAITLGSMGALAEPVIPALVRALNDRHPAVRRAAASALGELVREDETVVTVLRAALSDSSEEVRFYAAVSLAQLGHKDSTIVNALVAALRAKSGGVRFNATNAFMKADAIAAARALGIPSLP